MLLLIRFQKGEKKIAEMLVYFLNGAYQFFNQGANFPCKAANLKYFTTNKHIMKSLNFKESIYFSL